MAVTHLHSAEAPDDDSRDVHTVALDGERRVAYAEYGDPSGVPVLFLHGTPGSRALGALLDDHAAERGVRVLAPDRPGYGRSSPRPDASHVGDVDFAVAVLDDAGVDRTGVVAFSGGALSALALARERPGRVDGVDLVSGAVPPSLARETPPVQRALGALASHAGPLLRGLLWAQCWLADRRPPSFVLAQYADDPESVPDGAAAAFKRDFVEGVGPSRTGVVRELAALASPWPVDPAAIETRVTVRHGTADANVPLADARRLADSLPAGRLRTIAGADHATALLRSREAVLERDGDGADR